MLRIAVSHGHLANLVGASRPRVTEHLARLERDGMVIRQGRQLVVRADQLEASMSLRIQDLPIKMRETGARPRSSSSQLSRPSAHLATKQLN